MLSPSPRAMANDFYQGKTIRVAVGFSAGGGYDTYARIIARHMGKHIPGNPSFVVENMDGAGSLIAANYTYNKADRDGTFIGVWNSAYVLYQALGDRAILPRPLGLVGPGNTRSSRRSDAEVWVRGSGGTRSTRPGSARRAYGAWPSASWNVVVLD